jgi:hypothetical protein
LESDNAAPSVTFQNIWRLFARAIWRGCKSCVFHAPESEAHFRAMATQRLNSPRVELGGQFTIGIVPMAHSAILVLSLKLGFILPLREAGFCLEEEWSNESGK